MDKCINCKKSEDMIYRRYLDKFKDAVQALKLSGILMNVSKLIIKQEHGEVNSESTDYKFEWKEEAQNRFIAFGYVKGM